LPLVAPKRYFDLYQPDDTWLAGNPRPANGSPMMAWFNSDGYVGSAKQHGLTMPNPPDHQQAIDWNGYELRSYVGIPNQGAIDRSLQLEILQAYAACISYVDAQIGLLLDQLERSGRLAQTVVILCSDHGWHLGEQSAWSKMTNFEVATRVPLLIAAPGIEAGRTRSLAELVDLYPTVCQLVGVPTPPHLEGEALSDSLHQPNELFQEIALSQHVRFSEEFMGRAVRSDRFRFVSWTKTKSAELVFRELYDHALDPHETINVVDRPEYAAAVSRLESTLQDSFQFRDAVPQ
jgi:iduronate 2-sulfatase